VCGTSELMQPLQPMQPMAPVRRSGALASRRVEDDPLIPTGEVARRLGVTPQAVGRWVARGILSPAVTTPGGRYRFRWSEVEDQLRSNREDS
jgi:excisionase family DNA binding protein